MPQAGVFADTDNKEAVLGEAVLETYQKKD